MGRRRVKMDHFRARRAPCHDLQWEWTHGEDWTQYSKSILVSRNSVYKGLAFATRISSQVKASTKKWQFQDEPAQAWKPDSEVTDESGEPEKLRVERIDAWAIRLWVWKTYEGCSTVRDRPLMQWRTQQVYDTSWFRHRRYRAGVGSQSVRTGRNYCQNC